MMNWWASVGVTWRRWMTRASVGMTWLSNASVGLTWRRRMSRASVGMTWLSNASVGMTWRRRIPSVGMTRRSTVGLTRRFGLLEKGKGRFQLFFFLPLLFLLSNALLVQLFDERVDVSNLLKSAMCFSCSTCDFGGGFPCAVRIHLHRFQCSCTCCCGLSWEVCSKLLHSQGWLIQQAACNRSSIMWPKKRL